LSDPFSDIDSEVYKEKIKKYFFKYKYAIISALSLIIIIFVSLSFYNNYKSKKEIEASNYYIEILSIIDADQTRALNELKKLSKFNQKNYQNLSNFLILKLKLQNNQLDEALIMLNKVEEKIGSKSHLNRIIEYYYSQIYLDKKEKDKFDNYTKKLLTHGGMWAMLAHELRGHYYFNDNEYDQALKNFEKIITNQQATSQIRSRVSEMINNINLYDEKK